MRISAPPGTRLHPARAESSCERAQEDLERDQLQKRPRKPQRNPRAQSQFRLRTVVKGNEFNQSTQFTSTFEKCSTMFIWSTFSRN